MILRGVVLLLSLCWCAQAMAFGLGFGGGGLGMSHRSPGETRGGGLDLGAMFSSFKPLPREKAKVLGREIATNIVMRYGISQDAQTTFYVNEIGTVLAQRSGMPDIGFHGLILDSDEINAFSSPGGFVLVTRGLLHFVQDEAELAAVLAHELGHVQSRHIEKALRHARLQEAFAGASNAPSVLRTQIVQQATDMLFTTGLAAEDEYEADQSAMRLMQRTGYDYRALFDILKRLESQQGMHATKTLDRTHPSPSKRLKTLHRWIKKNELIGEPSPIRLRERFLQNLGSDNHRQMQPEKRVSLLD